MLPLSRRSWLFDAGLAVGLFAVAALTSVGDQDDGYVSTERLGPPYGPVEPVLPPVPPAELHHTVSTGEAVAQVLLLALIAAPLIFRRRYPLSVLWCVLVTSAFVGNDTAHRPMQLSFYAAVIAAYSAAVYSPYRVPALVSLLPAAFLFQQLQGGDAEPVVGGAISAVPQGVVPYLILLPIAVAAYGLRGWRSRADAERERAAEAERGRAEAVSRATARERARIARELHDVVTHNVSVMVIQAGAARKVLESSPGDAREALLAVESGGRAAMTELRHVMGLLTIDTDDPADAEPELAPQPGLSQVGPLVERVRRAGVLVELVVTGRPRLLPDGMDLAAYRVVQEALTNTVKHASGTSAVVRIDHGADRLWIEVTDTGAGAASGSGFASGSASGPDGGEPDGAGHGLIGLRERLAVYGGSLRAGPRIRGGFRVEAVLPYAALPDPEVAA
ncbi:sensor histidine kinase [Cryptosporangium phraense]|uniref:histidine kinase n=2 Tax=Cryptosporangium phraense TaxID=2593070 RepID=A0A545AU59_9ACTN|nr:sensor histidine kinase [Cryptosporangium phraense]